VKIWYLRNDIYHIPIMLILGKNKKEIYAYLKRIFKHDFEGMLKEDGCCFWIEWKEKWLKHYFIWIPEFHLHNPAWMACIAHEFYHLTGLNLHDSGVKEKEGGEAGAYYFDYMFEQALKKLMGKKKK
jgi:hypothetical protein